MELITQAEFARRVGKSRQYINTLVANGAIKVYSVPGKKSKYIKFEEAKKALEDIKDPTRDPQREANKKRKKKKPVVEELPEDTEVAEIKKKAKAQGIDLSDVEKKGVTLNKAKVFKEVWLGKLAQLDFKKKSGESISKSEVEKDAFEAGRLIRNRLEAIPHKLALTLVGLSDKNEIEEAIQKEINDVLVELSGRVGAK